MRTETDEIRDNLKYLTLLARDYPSQAAAASEIISNQALLKLPKGTEHFMSDLHGENEAFVHILNSASGVIREKGAVEIQAVGAGAANQAIKSVAIARGYLAPAGVDLVCIPAFANVEIDGAERTAIKLIVEPR